MKSVLIPASGSATRMRGLPKFLLPSGVNNFSILELHLSKIFNLVDEIFIGINPKFFDMVIDAKLELKQAEIFPLETNTMTETVLELAKSSADSFSLIMPDTIYENDFAYKILDADSLLTLGLWKIRENQFGKLGQIKIDKENYVMDCIDKDPNCKYEYSWGTMAFHKDFLNYLNKDFPTIGLGINKLLELQIRIHSIIIPDNYWDCGTTAEYIEYLRKVK